MEKPLLSTHQPLHLPQEHRGQRWPSSDQAEHNLRSQEKCSTSRPARELLLLSSGKSCEQFY